MIAVQIDIRHVDPAADTGAVTGVRHGTVMPPVVRRDGIAVMNTFLAQMNGVAGDLRTVVCTLDMNVDRLRNRSVMAVAHFNVEIQIEIVPPQFGMGRSNATRWLASYSERLLTAASSRSK